MNPDISVGNRVSTLYAYDLSGDSKPEVITSSRSSSGDEAFHF